MSADEVRSSLCRTVRFMLAKKLEHVSVLGGGGYAELKRLAEARGGGDANDLLVAPLSLAEREAMRTAAAPRDAERDEARDEARDEGAASANDGAARGGGEGRRWFGAFFGGARGADGGNSDGGTVSLADFGLDSGAAPAAAAPAAAPAAAAPAAVAATPAAESGRWLSRFGLGGSAERTPAKHGAGAASEGRSKQAAKNGPGFLARFRQRDEGGGGGGGGGDGGARAEAKERRRSSLTAGTAVTVSRLRAMDPRAKLFACRRLLSSAPQPTDAEQTKPTKRASAQLYPGRFLLVLGDYIVCVRGRSTPPWPLERGADAPTVALIEESIPARVASAGASAAPVVPAPGAPDALASAALATGTAPEAPVVPAPGAPDALASAALATGTADAAAAASSAPRVGESSSEDSADWITVTLPQVDCGGASAPPHSVAVAATPGGGAAGDGARKAAAAARRAERFRTFTSQAAKAAKQVAGLADSILGDGDAASASLPGGVVRVELIVSIGALRKITSRAKHPGLALFYFKGGAQHSFFLESAEEKEACVALVTARFRALKKKVKQEAAATG